MMGEVDVKVRSGDQVESRRVRSLDFRAELNESVTVTMRKVVENRTGQQFTRGKERVDVSFDGLIDGQSVLTADSYRPVLLHAKDSGAANLRRSPSLWRPLLECLQLWLDCLLVSIWNRPRFILTTISGWS